MPNNHQTLLETMVGFSTTEFYNMYLADNSEFAVEKFYINRGELNVAMTPWADPKDDEKTYESMPVKKVRQMVGDFQIKNNPLVKSAPTTLYFSVLEHTPTRFLMRVLVKTRNVPYCDSFAVENEWYIASPSETSKAAVLRVSMTVIFYKSPFVKGMIKSGAEGDSKAVWEHFSKLLIERNHLFKEQKRKVGKSINLKHQVESS